MNRISLKLITILLMLVGLVTEVSAANKADYGLALDSKAPALSALDITGNPTSIEQLSGKKGLILIFFRSADWCPYCKKHLSEINQGVEQLTALGYGVAGISYDSTETLSAFSKAAKLKFPLIADQKQKTIKAYNVLNKAYAPGGEHYGIPYPGVVVINKQGKITYKYFYEGYRKRVMVDTLIQSLGREKTNK